MNPSSQNPPPTHSVFGRLPIERIPPLPAVLRPVVEANWRKAVRRHRAKSEDCLWWGLEAYWVLHCLGYLDALGRFPEAPGVSLPTGGHEPWEDEHPVDFLWKILAGLKEADWELNFPKAFLREIHLICEVREGWAEVVWRLHFYNPSIDVLMPELAFPVPQAAAIHGFEVERDGEVLDEEETDGSRYLCSCEEVEKGILCIRPGVLFPGKSAIVDVMGCVPLSVVGTEYELVLPLGIEPVMPDGELLLRPDEGIGIFPDTTKHPAASRVSPHIQIANRPVLRLSVDLDNVVAQTIHSGTHPVSTFLMDGFLRVVQEGRIHNTGESFRLRWSIPEGDRKPRVKTVADGCHYYHIIQLATSKLQGELRSPDSRCEVVLDWSENLSVRSRRAALDCLSSVLAALDPKTEVSLVVRGRENRKWTEKPVPAGEFPVLDALARIKTLELAPRGCQERPPYGSIWIGGSPHGMDLPDYGAPLAIFVGPSRQSPLEEFLRATGRAVRVLDGDSVAGTVMPFVGRHFGQRREYRISGGTGGIDSGGIPVELTHDDSQIVLFRTHAAVAGIQVECTGAPAVTLPVQPGEWDAPQLLWARSRLVNGASRDHEKLADEVASAHGILTPGNLLAVKHSMASDTKFQRAAVVAP